MVGGGGGYKNIFFTTFLKIFVPGVYFPGGWYKLPLEFCLCIVKPLGKIAVETQTSKS